MSKEEQLPILDTKEWTSTPETVADELRSFVKEFELFTPELFAEVNFHLLRQSGLTKSSRQALCEISIFNKTCPKCELLYSAKKCPLWSRLYKIVTWDIVERAPPCIRLAFAKKTIKTVTNYLVAVNLVSPPFFKSRGAPSCNAMRRWGYCHPNEYCKAMETDNTFEYNAARERVKLSRAL
ncbi:MAG: hypothetical protein JW779_07890 [Candidatus Thorarchaeota archaeon]|nr:hypothetical protein [Candidatus Thorarchaeota archaeon]